MISTRLFMEKLERVKHVSVVSLTWKNEVLDDTSKQICLDAFHLWILSMWDCLPSTSRSMLYPHLIQLFYKLTTGDIFQICRFLSMLDEMLISLPPNQEICYDLFKGDHLGGTLYSGHILVPFRALSISSGECTRRTLRSLFCFMSRLTLNLDIQNELITEYLLDEQRLQQLVLDDQLVSDLEEIIYHWFSDFQLSEDAVPRHGPGGVAFLGRQPLSRKYRELGVDQLLIESIDDDLCKYYPDSIKRLDRTAQVIFVPKSFKTYRTICMEPATLQYWQQLYASEIDLYLQKHHYLRYRIDLHDQSKSQAFAREASRSRKWATIDLSKASDSVSEDLVKRVFRRTPLYRPLIGTRSDWAELPNGLAVKLKKFAPMGSALCFPIECVIFAAICELSCTYAHIDKRQYRVYGDDIIISSRAVPNLLILLDKLGFLPNSSKTHYCSSDYFRESCGGDYYYGENVTPVRLSRKFSGLSPRKDDCTSLIDLANSFYDFGLKSARLCVLDYLRRKNPHLAFSVPNGIGIWSDNPSNFHLKKVRRRPQGRSNISPLECDVVVRHMTNLTLVGRRIDKNEHIRLFEWYRRGGSLEDTISIERTRTAMRYITTPLWMFHREV